VSPATLFTAACAALGFGPKEWATLLIGIEPTVLMRAGFLLLGALAVGVFCWLLLIHRKVKIELISPVDGAHVDWKWTATGEVGPSGHPVRLLVFSGNNYWYPQQPASVTGETWRSICQFGNQDSASGSPYKLIAMDAAFAPSEKVLELPKNGARSRIIKVYRA
jgi:hypothetical protein